MTDFQKTVVLLTLIVAVFVLIFTCQILAGQEDQRKHEVTMAPLITKARMVDLVRIAMDKEQYTLAATLVSTEDKK
jgi:sensor histidine kinase regulating citrate/malate metabolism